MSKEDNKPGEPDDALSATGMFLGGFQTEEPPSAPAPSPKTPPRSTGPGEFTQLFNTAPTKSDPVPPPSPSAAAGEVTRVFPAPPVAPKMRGFSAPGASDSASAEGSFTQVFRTPSATPVRPPVPVRPSIPPPPVQNREWPSGFEISTSSQPPSPASESMGVTDLFRALSGNERPRVDDFAQSGPPLSSTKPVAATAPGESFTMLLQKLTEHAPPSPQNFETQQLAPAPAEGQGEFTRIITRGETQGPDVTPSQPVAEAKAPPLPPMPLAVPKPAVPTAPAAPKLAVPKLPVAAPKSKLQEMLPILLVLNAFLLVVLIVVVVFALMHR